MITFLSFLVGFKCEEEVNFDSKELFDEINNPTITPSPFKLVVSTINERRRKFKYKQRITKRLLIFVVVVNFRLYLEGVQL